MSEPFGKVYLSVEAGPKQGKVFPLKRQMLVIGSKSDADIRLEDRYVAETHAVIVHKDQRYWIENRAFNGTIVNDRRIDSLCLGNGDLIKIGESIVLKYVEETARKEPGERRGKEAPKASEAADGVPEEPDAKGAKQTLLGFAKRRPALTVMLVVYLLLIGMLFTYLSSHESGGADRFIWPTRDKISSYLEESARRNPHNAEPARSGAIGDEKTERDTLVLQIEEAFYSASVEEKQKRWEPAIVQYSRIAELVKDPYNPLFRLAMKRIQWNEERKRQR